MRILLTSYMEPWAPCGVRSYYQLLQAGLESEGIETRLITPLGAPRSTRLLTGAIRRMMGMAGVYPGLIAEEIKQWWRIHSAARALAWQPDVIHAQDPGSGTAAATAWANRIPLVVTAHFNIDPVEEMLARNNRSGHPARWLRHRFAGQFSAIRHYIAPSRYAAGSLQRLAPPGSRLAVIYNACDFEAIGNTPPAPDIRHLARDRVLLLSAGTLEPRKNPWFLVDLASALSNHDNLLILHAGEGPLRKEVEDAIASRRLTNIRLLGQRNDLAAVTHACHLFLHFPLEETFGLVVVEAIAAGVPVLAAKAGGIPEILRDSPDPCLYEPGVSPDAVARDILALVADPPKLTGLARAQHWPARERFDKPRFIRDVAEEYRRLAGSTRAP